MLPLPSHSQGEGGAVIPVIPAQMTQPSRLRDTARRGEESSGAAFGSGSEPHCLTDPLPSPPLPLAPPGRAGPLLQGCPRLPSPLTPHYDSAMRLALRRATSRAAVIQGRN